MRHINTLLVIALITFSYANAFEFASFAEVSEIQADPYGKSLLETISFSLSGKGNIDDVKNLLNELLFKLNEDQAKSDAWWSKENARLLAKIKSLTDRIEVLRQEISKLRAEKVRYEALRDQAAANLKQYEAQIAKNQQLVATNTKNRADDHADFIRSQNEHNDVLNALEAVINELKGLVGSVSDVNRPKHVTQNDEEKRDRLAKAFVQVSQEEAEINAFVELATSADQKAVQGLIEALGKIRDTTRKSYNADVKHEQRSLKDFESLMALLKRDIEKLNQMVAQETKNHKAYVQKVQELTVTIEQKRKLRASLKVEKAATIKERETKEAKYIADKAQRDRERKVIEKLQAIVKQRLENMSKYLKDASSN